MSTSNRLFSRLDMVWFEVLPSLILTAAPLLLVAGPIVYVSNWYFLNGKVCVQEVPKNVSPHFLLQRDTDREI